MWRLAEYVVQKDEASHGHFWLGRRNRSHVATRLFNSPFSISILELLTKPRDRVNLNIKAHHKHGLEKSHAPAHKGVRKGAATIPRSYAL